MSSSAQEKSRFVKPFAQIYPLADNRKKLYISTVSQGAFQKKITPNERNLVEDELI
jgi:hypothetical protein